MKKKIAILLVALIFILLLSSCGSMKTADTMSPPASLDSREVSWGTATSQNNAMTAPQAPNPDLPMQEETKLAVKTKNNGSGVVPVTDTIVKDNLSEKIIYTVNAHIETISFDETIDGVYKLLTANGGFIETSNIGGRNYAQSYYGLQTYRNAQFTVRIPKDNLNAVTASLEILGNVTSLSSNAENITAQFFDSESRLNSYNTQEERLLYMLSKTDNVTDMIAIEEKLAEVRYQIESLTTTLRNWQNQVDYSSVFLSINEVEVFTEVEPLQQRTYWQQIGDGFKVNTRNIGNFFKDLFKGLVINLPVFIILVVIAVVIIIIIRRQIRLRAKRIKKNPQFSTNTYSPSPQNFQYSQYPPNQQSSQDQQSTKDSQNQ